MSSDLEKTKAAIARVVATDKGGDQRTGTAFFVGGKHAITALHVVANLDGGQPTFSNIVLKFHSAGDHETLASVAGQLWDRDEDWVVLEIDKPPPAMPIEWAAVPPAEVRWECFGYPKIQEAGQRVVGVIRDPKAAFLMKKGAIAPQRGIQLYCEDAAAGRGAPLHGFSGAPCLVEGRAVGVMRKTLVETAENAQGQPIIHTQAATVYATPAERIISWQANRGVVILPGTWAPPEIVSQEFVVLLSEQERQNSDGHTLWDVANEAYRTLQDDDVSLSAPHCIFAAEAVSSETKLQNTIRALCRAKVVVFDATDFEPAIMFLVGIRAVLRRGVTLLSVGGTYALGKQLAVPFNVTDANIVSHSSAQKGAVELLAKRIRRGLEEMLSPEYFDLPVYDAIRSLPAERRGIIPSEDGVLVLCPFNETYGLFWEKNLKEALGTELNTLRKNRKLQGTPNFGICRSFELDSPRLVTKAVFEHIRRVQSCLIDLTDWSPNVLFELGVRLAASGERTACIIEESWEQKTCEAWKSQCRNLVSMFVPENFRYNGSKSWIGQSAFKSAYGRDAKAVAPLLDGWVHALVERTFDVESEPASRPVYVELLDQAAFFSRPPGSAGRTKPVGLFPGNQELLRREEMAEFERLLAAWFYVSNRYKDEILENDQLMKVCESISQALFGPHKERLTSEVEIDLTRVLEDIKTKRGDLSSASRGKITFEAKLSEVRALKRDATALRNRGEFSSALSTISEAIEQLQALSKEKESGERNLTDQQAKEIRSELADTFGMKGGIYRRKNELDAALEAYKNGRDIEDIDEQSTYNLSNVITLSITWKRRSPTDPEIRLDLKKAVKRLTADTEGPRKDEWWAWSDLAQAYLLSNDLEQARNCYAKGLTKTGATLVEIRRHVTVLEELADKITDKAREISDNIQVVIKELNH